MDIQTHKVTRQILEMKLLHLREEDPAMDMKDLNVFYLIVESIRSNCLKEAVTWVLDTPTLTTSMPKLVHLMYIYTKDERLREEFKKAEELLTTIRHCPMCGQAFIESKAFKDDDGFEYCSRGCKVLSNPSRYIDVSKERVNA